MMLVWLNDDIILKYFANIKRKEYVKIRILEP